MFYHLSDTVLMHAKEYSKVMFISLQRDVRHWTGYKTLCCQNRYASHALLKTHRATALCEGRPLGDKKLDKKFVSLSTVWPPQKAQERKAEMLKCAVSMKFLFHCDYNRKKCTQYSPHN